MKKKRLGLLTPKKIFVVAQPESLKLSNYMYTKNFIKRGEVR
jgi:hypothetical protein